MLLLKITYVSHLLNSKKLRKLKKLKKLKTIVFSLPFGSFLGFDIRLFFASLKETSSLTSLTSLSCES